MLKGTTCRHQSDNLTNILSYLISGQKNEDGALSARLLPANVLDDPVDEVGVEHLRPPVLALPDDLLRDDLDLFVRVVVVVDLGLVNEHLLQGRDDLLLEPPVFRQAKERNQPALLHTNEIKLTNSGLFIKSHGISMDDKMGLYRRKRTLWACS